MRFSWRTYEDLVECCRGNAERVRALNPDVVVGIPRSGMLPASLLATQLGIPLTDLRSFCDRRVWLRGDREATTCTAKRALLIDDASSFGGTMRRSLAMVKGRRPDVPLIMTAAVYATPQSAHKFTLPFELCPKPRVFEWNWFRHDHLVHCCVDIDGVLCIDPTREQVRDKKAYERFLTEARPLYRVTKPVGMLVTGRWEEFRTQTEAWMKVHGVQYAKLIMAPGPFDGDDPRPKDVAHAIRKAEVYRRTDHFLFIESNDTQAQEIARRSGKDVLCITNRKMY